MSDDTKQTILKLQELLNEGVLSPEEYLAAMNSVLEAHEQLPSETAQEATADSEQTTVNASPEDVYTPNQSYQAPFAPAQELDATSAQPAVQSPSQTYAQPQTQPFVPPAAQPVAQSTTTTPVKKKGGCLKIVAIVVGVILLLSIISTCNSTGKKSPSGDSSAATKTEHEHVWVGGSCTEPAHCEVCGIKGDDASGHTVDKWKVEKEATCVDDGVEIGTCSVCGEEVEKTIPKTGEHVIENWEVVQEATCSSTGLAKGTCKYCGHEEEYEIPAKEHTPGEWYIASNFTINSDGSVESGWYAQNCTVCGQIIDYSPYTVELTVSQKNALRSAQSYLRLMAFSYSGLVEQLEFEGYSYDDAVFAVDNCGADWYEQAAKSAESYVNLMPFSRSGLIEQLEFEGFTYDQAAYGASAVGL